MRPLPLLLLVTGRGGELPLAVLLAVLLVLIMEKGLAAPRHRNRLFSPAPRRGGVCRRGLLEDAPLFRNLARYLGCYLI